MATIDSLVIEARLETQRFQQDQQEFARQVAFSAEEIARFEEQHRRQTAARAEQAARQSIEQSRNAIRRQMEVAEAIYRESQGRIKLAQFEGLLTPEEARQAAVEAANEYNQAIVETIERGRGIDRGAVFRGREGTELFGELAGSIRNVDTSSRGATVGLSRLNYSMASLLRQATGTNPAIAQLANVMGTFAVGSATMVAVLAGLSAVAFAWRRMGQESRDAREEMDRALDSLERIAEHRRIEDLGPGGAILESETQVVARLQQLADERQAILQRLAAPAVTGTGLTTIASTLAEDTRKLQENADEQLLVLQRWARGMEQAQIEKERATQALAQSEVAGLAAVVAAGQATAAEFQQAADLLEAAQRRFAELGRLALTPQVAADRGEALQRVQQLEGAFEALAQAAKRAAEEGGRALQAEIQLLGQARDHRVLQIQDIDRSIRLQAALRQEMERGNLTLARRVEIANQLENLPDFEPGRASIAVPNAPITIGGVTIENPEEMAAEYRAQVARKLEEEAVRANLNLNLQPDPRGDERREEEARQRARQAAQQAATEFNQVVQAGSEVFSAFGDLADAADVLGVGFADALRGLETFAGGMMRIRAGQALDGTLGALTQMSGAISMAAGVIQVIEGFRTASRDRAEMERRMAHELANSVESLRQWSAQLDESRFDTLSRQREEAAAKVFMEAVIDAISRQGMLTIDAMELLGPILEQNLPFDELVLQVEAALRSLGLWTDALEAAVEIWRRDMERIEELRQRDIASMMDDIEVRALLAQGMDKEAQAKRLAIQHEKELMEARRLGFTAEQEARMLEVQAMERAALEADRLADAFGSMLNVPQGFRILNMELARFNAMVRSTAEDLMPPPSTAPPPPRPGPPGIPPPTSGPGVPQVPRFEDHSVTTINVTQLPGEDGEALADRVITIMRRRDKEDALTRGEVPW